MNQVSYCATHNTYPAPDEPCWACANSHIQSAGEAMGYTVFATALRLTCPYCNNTTRVHPYTQWSETLLHHMHQSKERETLYHCEAHRLRMAYPEWSEQWNREQGIDMRLSPSV